MNQLELPALDGANPLGFLAALGTLTVLSDTDPTLKLGWRQRARWTPFLQSAAALGEDPVVAELVKNLRASDPASTSSASEEVSIGPLSQCTPEALHRFAAPIAKNASLHQRRVADMVAAFGIEKRETKKNATAIQRTPFCFTTGSGHQEFISDARQLMTRKDPTKGKPHPPPCISVETVRAAIFGTWNYSDPGLSFRWDPAEDVRYALRLDDPGPIGAYTVWMANLLAYRAMVFFPCAEMNGRRMASGWCGTRKLDTFSWALWKSPLSEPTIRSLISSAEFAQNITPTIRAQLRARGVATVFSSRRIEVGTGSNIKINFSQANQA